MDLIPANASVWRALMCLGVSALTLHSRRKDREEHENGRTHPTQCWVQYQLVFSLVRRTTCRSKGDKFIKSTR